MVNICLKIDHSCSLKADFILAVFSITSSNPKATRLGSLTAFSPPSNGQGLKWATRCQESAVIWINSPPQIVPSKPYPVPSQATPKTGGCS